MTLTNDKSNKVEYTRLTLVNKVGRILWIVTSFILFKPFTFKIFNPWRLFVLRLFGAKLHPRSGVYSSVTIWAPWNLEMDTNAWLGPKVDCFNAARIKIGANATISQKSYLCAASHDYTKSSHPLITSPIIIEDHVWIAADAFIGPGVKIGQGAVVGARACVFKDVEPWTVVGGNPAKFIKKRIIND
jgi:putative colanic acid biosynthesis acetyltransferase WcaF